MCQPHRRASVIQEDDGKDIIVLQSENQARCNISSCLSHFDRAISYVQRIPKTKPANPLNKFFIHISRDSKSITKGRIVQLYH